MSAGDAAFCDAFVAALYGRDPGHPVLAALAAQPGFAVYRNTVSKACVDALAANYPAVVRLTGERWFHGAALDHARAAPPVSPSLLDYGEDFPAFLARGAADHGLPYLAGVAALDRMWMEVHTAADAPVLAAAALAALAPADLGATVLAPHPAARWVWSSTMPLVSIWRDSRAARAPAQPDWRAEGVLLTRPHGGVEELDIGPGAAAFLDACAGAAPLAQAAARACAVESRLDVASTLAALLGAGAFLDNVSLDSESHD